MQSGSESAAAACAICNGALGRTLVEIREPDRFEKHVGIATTGYRRSWIACDQCGSATDVYGQDAHRRLSEIAAGYYEVDFSGSSIGEKFARVMSMPRSQSDNAHRVERVLWLLEEWNFLARRPRGALRVLDIGAGTGVFLAKLLEQAATRNIDVSATGVEPDPRAAAHLRGLGRFEVIEGLYSAQLGLTGFDLCTINKVLEHIPQPEVLLRAAAAALVQPGGVLYVEVPDVLTASHRPPSDNVLGALHHHLYSPAGLEQLGARVGLRVLQLNRVFEPSGKISIGAFMVTDATMQYLAGSH
jgi:2-polyprenyl-3-methyl-5-hydroxy-6-metoxy-1,4-benzoquinol methylase